MKKLKYIFVGSALLLGTLTSCDRDENLDPNSVFVDPVITPNALDNYIQNNLVKPYNIQVLYRFVDRESDLAYNLVPARYESSVRLTKLLIHLGLEPYDKLTGSKEFIRNYFPKIVNFIGYSAVRNNGTQIAGTAENGLKMTLYSVNGLNATTGINPNYLTSNYFKTVQHEFQHILNQTKPFPTSFNEITGLAYVDDAWNTIYDTQAKAITAGFISSYAGKAPEEDFAELFSFYVTRTQSSFDAIVNTTGGTAAGRALIATKLSIVKTYMKTQWNIDMDELRAELLERGENLASFDQTTL